MALAKKLLRNTGYSLKGLALAYQRDISFRLEVWSGILFLVFGYMLWPLRSGEVVLLTLSFILILITELINTAIECAMERLHPERHALIGATKDLASAAVFLSICFGIIVAIVIYLSHGGILKQ